MDDLRNTGEYLPQYDVYIQYVKLPRSVKGSAAKVRGEPVAVINDSLTEDEKLLAICHEIIHLVRGDLDRDADIRTLEGGKS